MDGTWIVAAGDNDVGQWLALIVALVCVGILLALVWAATGRR
jgi:hypothetical protein